MGCLHIKGIVMDKKLPWFCAVDVEGEICLIMKGQMGYIEHTADYWDSYESAAEWNHVHNVNDEQQQCMVAGSMFGWDVPAAIYSAEYLQEVEKKQYEEEQLRAEAHHANSFSHRHDY